MKRKLLSILLALSMCLSLLPTMAFAAGEKVAKVGETEFATLDAAIDAAADDATIKLVSDVTLGSMITLDKDLTVDLNSYQLGCDASVRYPIKISEGKTVTFKDSAGTGSVTQNYKTTSANLFDVYGTLNIESGTYASNGSYGVYYVYSSGVLNITGGTSRQTTDGQTKIVSGSSSGTKNITGGYFNRNTVPVAAGYKLAEETVSEETLYKPVPLTADDATASITRDSTTLYFETLTKAHSAATSGDQIVLLKDSEDSLTLKDGVTIAVGSTTYTGTLTAFDNVHYVKFENDVYSNALRDANDGVSVAYVIKGDSSTTYYYDTLAHAHSAATSGDQIVLIRDCSENVTLKAFVTLNENGTNYTGTVSKTSSKAFSSVQKTNGIWENVPVSAEGAEASVAVGDTTYYYAKLKEAVSEYYNYDVTIKLLKDVEITSADVTSNYDSWIKEYVPSMFNAFYATLDGSYVEGDVIKSHSITYTGAEDAFAFRRMEGKLSHVTFKGMNDAISCISGDYYVPVYEYVDIYGEMEVTGNDGAYVIYAGKGQTFDHCTNYAKITGTGFATDYNAVFVGYVICDPNQTFTFTNCVNQGVLSCGKAAMFVGNPSTKYMFSMNVENCSNGDHGIIQSTYVNDSYNMNYYMAVDSNCPKIKLNGTEFTAKTANFPNIESDTGNGVTNNGYIKNGPIETGMEMARYTDGTFRIKPATDDKIVTIDDMSLHEVAYYEFGLGLYTSVADGSSRYYATERVNADAIDGYYKSKLKDLQFVDSVFVDGGATSLLSGNKTFTKDNVTYYVLPAGNSTNGSHIPKAAEYYYVAAFDADGKLLASAEMPKNSEGVATPVAQITKNSVTTQFATLQAALGAAAAGDTVKLLSDIVLTENAGVMVPAGLTMTLDLNGKNLSNNLTEAATSQIILNKGNLTIQDTSDGANGSISTLAEPDSVGNWHSTPRRNYRTVAINNEGTLTLKSGKIVSTPAGGIAYAIDNGSAATLNIDGGTVETLGAIEAIRMIIYSSTNTCTVNINGGTITGSGAVWMQADGANVKGVLNITDGTLNTKTGYRIIGFEADDAGTTLNNVKVNVSGGYFAKGNSATNTGYPFETENFDGATAAFAPCYIELTGGLFHTRSYNDQINDKVGDLNDLCASGYVCIANTAEATKGDYPFKVVPEVKLANYCYKQEENTMPAPVYPSIDGTTATVYYSSKTFLDTENKGIEWKNITGTTLIPGNYFMKAVYTKDGVIVAETPQTTFTITKGTQAAPTAPTTSGNIVTVEQADRNVANKTLEYAVDGTDKWMPVPKLTAEGAFTVSGLAAGVHTVYLRWRENNLYNESAASVGAEFELTQYSVKYNANYGVGSIASQTADTGTSITVASGDALSRTGYTFEKWNTAANGTGTAYAPGASIDTGATLYAQWKANTYTVQFNANGGTGTIANERFTYDAAEALTAKPEEFKKEGYTFAGWATSATGPVKYLNGQSVKNLSAVKDGTVTLYAVWTQNTSTVTGTIKTNSAAKMTLELKRGATVIDKQNVTPSSSGSGSASADIVFNTIPYGTYNLVITQDNVVVTQIIVNSVSTDVGTITMPDSNVNSLLEVKGEDTQPVVVGNLDKEAESKAEEDKNVFVVMTVEKQEEQELPETATVQEQTTQEAIVKIKETAVTKTQNAVTPAVKPTITEDTVQVEYLNITVEKYVGAPTMTMNSLGEATTTETVTETNNVIEIVVPYDMSGKENIIVYRYHDNQAEAFTKNTGATKPTEPYGDGTYWLDVTNNLIYIYAQKFSTYGISYTEATEPPTPPTGGGAATYAVSVASAANGKVSVDRKSAAAGATVTVTVKPDADYKLGTLTVKDDKGNAVTLTKSNDTTYTFKMPASAVTVTATFVKADADGVCPKDATCPIEPFTDTRNDEWWHDGIHYCVENGMMNGFPGSVFKPNDPLSRAQIVTMLWRLEGSPVVNYAMSFADVPSYEWFVEPVRWAQSTGVVTGYDAESFGPNDNVTREQLAAVLMRYAAYKGIDVSARADLAKFTDTAATSDWAVENVKWANAVGMVNGRTETTIVPTGTATRAEAAAMFQRFCENVVK